MLLRCCGGIPLLLASFLLVAQAARLEGQDVQSVLDTSLRGITSVSVFMNDIDADAESDGLLKSQIKTAVELRLRQSAIRVVPESPADGLHAAIWVAVNTKKLRQVDNYIFDIQTRVLRDVVIAGNKQSGTAITWWTPTAMAITPIQDLAKHVREVVNDQIDALANAYLSVNAKK